jgi:hypothetical protein
MPSPEGQEGYGVQFHEGKWVPYARTPMGLTIWGKPQSERAKAWEIAVEMSRQMRSRGE